MSQWTFAERFVWKKLTSGSSVRFARDAPRYRRILQGRFIETIVRSPDLSAKITYQGIHIINAEIQGGLDLSHVTFPRPLRLEECFIQGKVSLVRARIDGLINFTGTHIRGPLHPEGFIALDLNELRAGSAVLLDHGTNGELNRRSRFEGSIKAVGATIERTLQLCGGTVVGEFDAGGIRSGESVFLRYGSTFQGDVLFPDAEIGGSLDLERSTFEKDFKMIGAKIDGSLVATDAVFGKRLNIAGTTINQTLFLLATKVSRKASLIEVKVGHSVQSGGAVFGAKVDMRRFSTHHDLTFGPHVETNLLDGVTIEGKLLLEDGRIGGKLDVRQSKLRGKTVFSGTRVDGELCVSDSGGRPDALALELDGFTYSRISIKDEWRQWISLYSGPSVQPFQQLAKAFRNGGNEQWADDALYEGRIRDLEGATKLRRLGLLILRESIGFGIGKYFFLRALRTIFCLVCFGALVASAANLLGGITLKARSDQAYSLTPDVVKRSGPVFDDLLDPFVFSLNELLPLAQFDRSLQFARPVGMWKIYFLAHKIAGYVLGVLIATGIAGMTQRRQ